MTEDRQTFEVSTTSKRIQEIESWLRCPACGGEVELKMWKSIGFKCTDEECGRYLQAFEVEGEEHLPDRSEETHADLTSFGGDDAAE